MRSPTVQLPLLEPIAQTVPSSATQLTQAAVEVVLFCVLLLCSRAFASLKRWQLQRLVRVFGSAVVFVVTQTLALHGASIGQIARLTVLTAHRPTSISFVAGPTAKVGAASDRPRQQGGRKGGRGRVAESVSSSDALLCRKCTNS